MVEQIEEGNSIEELVERAGQLEFTFRHCVGRVLYGVSRMVTDRGVCMGEVKYVIIYHPRLLRKNNNLFQS